MFLADQSVMSLSAISFEVQRLWSVWPLNNVQVMRSIFRTSTELSPLESVEGVHVIPGHVFIVRHQPQVGEASQEVYVFDNEPKSTDQPSRSDSLPGSSNGSSDMRSALLTVPSAPVVAVCRNPLRPHQVYMVDQQGLVEVWVYNVERRQWKEDRFYKLKSDGPVCAAVYVPTHQCVVWSERVESNSSLSMHCVKQQQLVGDRDHSLHSCSTVLSDVTDVTLTVLTSSVQISIQMKKFCYFWYFKEEVLVPYLWDTSLPLSVCQLKTPCNHRRITLQLVSLLSKKTPPPSGCVVTTTVHPATQELIILTDRGIVFAVASEDVGRKTHRTKKIVKLIDFEEHHPFFSARHRTSEGDLERRGSTLSGRFELFIYQSYVGIVNMGVVRFYDVHSGEMVWSYDEHESTKTRLWRVEGPVPMVGLWTEDGLWIIRSGKVTEQAEFLVKGQFPVTTNADGTTPWDYLISGPKFAAQLCQKWNLKLWCSKYALDEIYEMVAEYKHKISNEIGNDTIKRPHIDEELLDMSLKGLQNPSLVLALLADIPECQHVIAKRIEKFLDDYKSTEDQVSPLHTPLNRDIVPLLQEYMKVYYQYRQVLNNLTGEDGTSSSTTCEEVKDILTSFYKQGDLLQDSAAMGLKAQFERLSVTEPQETLKGIKEYLGIESFVEACQNGRELVGDHDWRAMLMAEPTPLPLGLDPHRPYRILLFETLCRLLYMLDPEELVPFIVFVEEARNIQSQKRTAYHRQVQQGFYWQRALEALPLVPENLSNDRDSGEGEDGEDDLVKIQVRTKCKILIQSEIPNGKMAALTLLLKNKLWKDGIEFYNSVIGTQEEVTEATRSCLYQTMLTSFLQGGVYSHYHKELSSMMPGNFNIQAFLTSLDSLRASELSGRVSQERREVFAAEDDTTVVKVGQMQDSLVTLLSKPR